MKIEKIINNNVISAIDDRGIEIVAMGKGIGFSKKVGQEIEESGIEKIFRMENKKVMNQFKNLLKDLPLEHIQISNDIISYAKKILRVRLNQNIYITLTDHINFAIVRHQQGMIFQNILLNEVRMYYPEEYKVGKYALELIKQKLKIELPASEEASVALHVVTAEYHTQIRDVCKIIDAIQGITEIVKEELNIMSEEDNPQWNRFISGTKFLRMEMPSEEEEDELYNFIKLKYPAIYGCSEKISLYLEKEFGQKLTHSEKAYLAMDLKRLQKSSLLS